MKKKTVLGLLIITMVISSIFAKNSAPWWENKTIYKITYQGLQNSYPIDVDYIISNYVGDKFTNELFDELLAKLYSTNKFAYILNEALKGGPNKDKLVLNFELNELPYVQDIKITGLKSVRQSDIEKAINIKKGDFLQEGDLNGTKKSVIALFEDKGYADIKVDYNIDINNETNKATINIDLIPNRQSIIGEIAFTGNNSYTGKTLRSQLESSTKSIFNRGYLVERAINQDKKNIVNYYKNHGYINAEVTDMTKVLIESKEDYDLYKIVYNIKENKHWYLGDVKYEGNIIKSDEDLIKNQSIETGDVANISAIKKEIHRISLLYANEGYISVGINVNQDLKKDVVQPNGEKLNILNLTISISEGKRSVVKKIIINGLEKTKSYVLEREVDFKIGDYITANGLINTNNNFLNSGIVTSVKYDLQPIEGTSDVIVVFNVTENSQVDVKFGATFGATQDSFPISGLIQFSDKNLAGTGRDLSVSSQLGAKTQSITVGFNDDWFNNIRWQNGFNIGFEHSYKSGELQKGVGSDYKIFNRNKKWYPKPYASYDQWVAAGKPGVETTAATSYLMSYHLYTISLGYATGYTWMFDAGRLSIGGGITFKFRRAVFDNSIYQPLDGLINEYGKQFKMANSINFNILWDGRGVIDDPSNGYFLQEQITYAGGILFGLSNYIRSTTTAAGFLKVFEVEREDNISIKGILSLTTTLDVVFPQYFKQNFEPKVGKWDSGIDALTSEMPYIDGMSIARGHSDMGENKKNLEFVIDNILDFSVPVYKRIIWISAFASATGAQNSMSDISNKGLNWFFAFGAGVRLKLPGFPLAFYFVKDAQVVDNKFNWLPGPIFNYKSNVNSGLRFVVAITSSIY